MKKLVYLAAAIVFAATTTFGQQKLFTSTELNKAVTTDTAKTCDKKAALDAKKDCAGQACDSTKRAIKKHACDKRECAKDTCAVKGTAQLKPRKLERSAKLSECCKDSLGAKPAKKAEKK